MSRGTIYAKPEMDDDDIMVLKGKLRHILTIYPRLSHSMIQVAMGIPAREWRPVLQMMISEGEVTTNSVELETPAGRIQQYTIIALAGNND